MLGRDCRNAASELPNSPPAHRVARPVGQVRLANQDHHVQRRKFIDGDFAQLAMRHPFVGRTEILANVSREIIDSQVQQCPSNGLRRIGFAGEQPHLVGHANLVEHAFQIVIRQIRQHRLFPALFHPGKSKLHAADVRNHLESVFAELVAKIARHAVEQRIAGCQHDQPLPLGRGDPSDGGREIAADRCPFVGQSFDESQRRLIAQQQIGLFDQATSVGRQAVEPIVADADDVNDLRAGHAGQQGAGAWSWGGEAVGDCKVNRGG